MTIYTVVRMTEDGDTIPFTTAYRTLDLAIQAVAEDAMIDGIKIDSRSNTNNRTRSITSTKDEDGNYTEEWLITQISVVVE